MIDINVLYGELSEVIRQYLVNNYEFDYMDVFEDQLVIHIDDKTSVCIDLNISKDEEV